MDPKYLIQMLEECKNNDFIFASRYLNGGGSEDDDLVTLIGNKIFTFLGNFFYDLNLSDILYTFILGKTSKAKELALSYSDFRICVEIPFKIKKRLMNYKSIPSFERKRIAGKKSKCFKGWFSYFNRFNEFFLENSFYSN